jgi:hypothetical protein
MFRHVRDLGFLPQSGTIWLPAKTVYREMYRVFLEPSCTSLDLIIVGGIDLCLSADAAHCSGPLIGFNRLRERLNKGLELGQGGMAICSVSTKQVYWAVLMPYWGGCTVAGLVADTLRPLAAR